MSLNRNASVTTKSSQHPAAVEAVLNYLAPTNERTRTYINNPPPGELRTTVVPEAHVVLIVNLRPFASSVSLDREGFSLVHHDTAVTDFYDDEEVKAIYYPEVERTLKVATGADRVLITGHITRRRVPGAENSWTSIRQPLARVHVDNTARSGPQRLRDLLLEDAEELLRGRVQIVNLWRPIRGPVKDSPLAVCDANSVSFGDLVPSDLIIAPHRVSETYLLSYNSAHRWFYVPEMGVDEALLLKCFDSKTDGRARFTPHSAFTDPTAPADAPPRESIEVRTLVFHQA